MIIVISGDGFIERSSFDLIGPYKNFIQKCTSYIILCDNVVAKRKDAKTGSLITIWRCQRFKSSLSNKDLAN